MHLAKSDTITHKQSLDDYGTLFNLVHHGSGPAGVVGEGFKCRSIADMWPGTVKIPRCKSHESPITYVCLGH